MLTRLKKFFSREIVITSVEKTYAPQTFYNLHVEGDNTYYVTSPSTVDNPILVHNCIDALRYAVGYQLENPNKGNYFIY